MVEKQQAMLPTFAFAQAGHLPALLHILAMPISPHPAFSIMRYDGRVPVIADREIESLRGAEERAARAVAKQKRKVFAPGARVLMQEGSYAGLRGIVQGGDGKFALVSLGGRLNVKVATFLLISDELVGREHSPNTGPAAIAA
jgi:hypothetical protein